MKKALATILVGIAALAAGVPAQARTFVHPGLSYTQGQIDRMKAMVEAKEEPFYTTFQNMLSTEYTDLNRQVADRGTQIREGQFNGTVGRDGRCAHDLALVWKITGDRRYADKAVEFLNANSHYTNTSARGTGPLDNGKVNLLIEAAELMRDYDGWKAEDQQRFKDMLTYPYYSNTEDVCAKYVNWSNDDQNGITFYWNIFNGDAGRHGNQGMFGMLAMLSMGVYLDNEIIYDRALRYVSGLPHRSDDLPYPPGPPNTSSKPTKTGEYMDEYSLNGRKNDIEDYGYDELLKYYFYPNGQCQESSRDQGHVLAGVHKYIEFAEIAWNQGDRFYSLEDNRLLKGIEFNYRYNLSNFMSYPDQTAPWEPAGYTTNPEEVTLDNNMYLQTRTRSGRWYSKKPSPDGRGGISNVGSRESAYAHYIYRAGESEEATKWLRRTRDYTMDKYGFETWGSAPNWYYEWNGWGTLTKTLGTWMAGDPVSYASGQRVSGIHKVPGAFSAADYDYYNLSEDGEGHTYHKVQAAAPSAYRPDGGVSLAKEGDAWVVNDCRDGEWLHYTIASPVGDTYDVMVTYKSGKAVTLGAAVSGSETVSTELPAAAAMSEVKVATVHVPAGASVLRLYVVAGDPSLNIQSVRLVYNSSLEKSAELTGRLDARNKSFIMDWEFIGILADNVEVLRGVSDNVEEAEVISDDNSLGHLEDKTIEGTVPGYTYWVRYTDNGQVKLTAPVSFLWGELNDTFANEEEGVWTVPGANGTVEYADGMMTLTAKSDGLARLGRAWSFPFHGGNYPFLAFCVEMPADAETALYSGADSWNNGYDKFAARIPENVFYYNLTDGSFMNAKGVAKTTVATDQITPLPLQLRFKSLSQPARFRWVRTFRTLEDLKVAAANSEVIEIEGDVVYDENAPIYNLTGVYCGTDLNRLPAGIYVRASKKILVK